MSRVCTVCRHPERKAIETALIARESLRDIESRFGTKRSSVDRHKAKCLAETLSRATAAANAAHSETLTAQVQASSAANVAHADDLIAQVHKLAADAQRIATAAEASKDFRTALAGVRELTRIVELLAKLRGDINEGTNVNVMNVGVSDPVKLEDLRERLAAKLANAAAPQQPIIMPALASPPMDARAPLVIDVEPAE